MGNNSDYSNNIEGVPLPGDLPQVAGSAAPNEPRSFTLENPEGDADVPYAEDYFDAEEARLGGPEAPFVPDKSNQQWSVGISDEENDEGPASFGELDNDWNEGVFPETEPLQVQGAVEAQSDDELSYTELEPDNIQHGPE